MSSDDMLSSGAFKFIKGFVSDRKNEIFSPVLEIVDKFGGVNEINKRAKEVRKYDVIISKLDKINPLFLEKLRWLERLINKDDFISVDDYVKAVTRGKFSKEDLNWDYAITLEISACNFFNWLIEEAKKAVSEKSLMPARYIRVRNMKEQEKDGDLLAFSAAMSLFGSSYVQTLDTKGTMKGPDGRPINVHLGGAETITGYFGGIGIPNKYSLEWVRELLYYYTNYGIPEFLNFNLGTLLLGMYLYRLGIDVRFKVSVYLGVDNPYFAFAVLSLAKLFERPDGSVALSGLNLSNSVDVDTMLKVALIRKALGLEDKVRIEHHVVESYKGIVIQPYDKLSDIIEIAGEIKNVSAKHEGAVPEVDVKREHPSNILEYFISKEEIEKQNLWDYLLINYLDKHDAVNRTAREVIKKGIGALAAPNLH